MPGPGEHYTRDAGPAEVSGTGERAGGDGVGRANGLVMAEDER